MHYTPSEPIWFSIEFMLSQPASIRSVETSDGVSLVFRETQNEIDVGFVGPYGIAFPKRSTTKNLEAIRMAWLSLIELAGVKPISVRTPPQSFYPAIVRDNLKAIQELGFELKYVDVNHSISLENSETGFNRNRRRDFAKCKNLGMVFEEVPLGIAMDVISANRQSRGIPLTLSLEQLRDISLRNPGIVSSYGVRFENKYTSAAVVFKESVSVAYVFMWGHDPSISHSSESMSALAHGLIGEAKSRMAEFLSLGTSSLQGQLNDGLVRFKESLGAASDGRATFQFRGAL